MMVRRTGIFYLGLMMAFAAVLFRTYWLSIGENAQIAAEAVNNREKSLVLYRTKGIIYDCNLEPIAGDQKCTYLLIDPREFQRKYAGELADFCGESKEKLLEKLSKETPFVVQGEGEVDPQWKGIFAYEGVARYSGVASHLLGYLDHENEVGLSGIEKEYNDYLDLFSSEVSVSYTADALNGIMAQGTVAEQKDNLSKDGLVLTLDKELCLALERVMDQNLEKGAAVILDCKSGAIKGICSFPDYDEERISDYLQSSEGELINRALSSQAVGSVFKIILAACALENDLEGFEYICTGGIVISDQTIACHNHSGHGKIGLQDAFAQSCNSYFIALGQMLGYDTIREMAERFGFGEQINVIGSMKSSAGIFPAIGGGLALANLSIGQGELMASPLQIAKMTAIIANNGQLPRVHALEGLYLNGKIKENEEGGEIRILEEAVAEKIKTFCEAVVSEGTGKGAQPTYGKAGGKTSSAQTGIIKDGAEQLNVYFTGFYPAEDPQYAITIFAESGDSGGKTCGPIFAKVCDFIAENRLTQ